VRGEGGGVEARGEARRERLARLRARVVRLSVFRVRLCRELRRAVCEGAGAAAEAGDAPPGGPRRLLGTGPPAGPAVAERVRAVAGLLQRGQAELGTLLADLERLRGPWAGEWEAESSRALEEQRAEVARLQAAAQAQLRRVEATAAAAGQAAAATAASMAARGGALGQVRRQAAAGLGNEAAGGGGEGAAGADGAGGQGGLGLRAALVRSGHQAVVARLQLAYGECQARQAELRRREQARAAAASAGGEQGAARLGELATQLAGVVEALGEEGLLGDLGLVRL
jgi:hypothetical protein